MHWLCSRLRFNQNQGVHKLPIFDTSLDAHQTIHSLASNTARPHHMATQQETNTPKREREETRTKHVYASDDSTGLLSPYSSSRGKCRSKPYRWFIICPRLHVAHWLSLYLLVWLVDCLLSLGGEDVYMLFSNLVVVLKQVLFDAFIIHFSLTHLHSLSFPTTIYPSTFTHTYIHTGSTSQTRQGQQSPRTYRKHR